MFNPPGIVMIDCSPEAAEMVRFALWRGNLRCIFQAYGDAASARRGLLQQRRRSSDGPPPALILLESELDHSDGLEVLRDLRADRGMAEVPVVVFPSHDMEGEREAMAAGATEYRPKPVDAEAYARCIVEFYRRWCQGRANDVPACDPAAAPPPAGVNRGRRRGDRTHPEAADAQPNASH